MQLDPKEKRSVWWKGALRGALNGIPQGILLGLAGALIIGGLAATIMPFLTPAFGTFLFTSTGELTLSSMIPFVMLNAALTVAGNFITGGNAAVNAYHQQKHNLRDEAKLIELDERCRTLEQSIAPSRAVQKIIEAGPRHHANFASTQADREQAPQPVPTR